MSRESSNYHRIFISVNLDTVIDTYLSELILMYAVV